MKSSSKQDCFTEESVSRLIYGLQSAQKRDKTKLAQEIIEIASRRLEQRPSPNKEEMDFIVTCVADVVREIYKANLQKDQGAVIRSAQSFLQKARSLCLMAPADVELYRHAFESALDTTALYESEPQTSPAATLG
ncbi:MAG: hypothetical protein L6Q57_08155 [Alphaproteobacteria bacterium]|nr:hypothetical protein [Alphaproteobacteria bacterium]